MQCKMTYIYISIYTHIHLKHDITLQPIKHHLIWQFVVYLDIHIAWYCYLYQQKSLPSKKSGMPPTSSCTPLLSAAPTAAGVGAVEPSLKFLRLAGWRVKITREMVVGGNQFIYIYTHTCHLSFYHFRVKSILVSLLAVNNCSDKQLMWQTFR